MTTNPEQADTVPPLGEAKRSELGRLRDALEEGAVVSLEEWVQIACGLGGRVEHLQEELRKANDLCGQLDRSAERAQTELEATRRQRNEALAELGETRRERDELANLDPDEKMTWAEYRRRYYPTAAERDERPAGRVVWRQQTRRALPNGTGGSYIAPPIWPDVPPGTEMAVVVVADDSGEDDA